MVAEGCCMHAAHIFRCLTKIPICIPRSNVLRLFVKYDTENSGRLSMEQLEKALKVELTPKMHLLLLSGWIYAFDLTAPLLIHVAHAGGVPSHDSTTRCRKRRDPDGIT
jgi:hypothetical protein